MERKVERKKTNEQQAKKAFHVMKKGWRRFAAESIPWEFFLASGAKWRYAIRMIIVCIKLCLAGAAGLVILALL